MTEHMEISPLPHKMPLCSHIEVTYPSPLSTPSNSEMMIDSPVPSCQTSLEPPMPVMPEYAIPEEFVNEC